MSSSTINQASSTAAAANNATNGNSVTTAANSGIDVSRLDDMVRAKVGAGVGTDFIPTWDQSRVEEGMMVSFLDDPLPENQRIKLASRLIGGPGSLVLALCPDAPSFVPVSQMTLQSLEEAVFSPPSKEREFFFQAPREKDQFRASLEKAAAGEASEHSKLIQFIFRKAVVALAKGIIRQVLIMKQQDGSLVTLLQHRGLFSTESRKIEKIRLKRMGDRRQSTLNFKPSAQFAEEEKENAVDVPSSASSDGSDEDLLSSQDDLFGTGEIPPLYTLCFPSDL